MHPYKVALPILLRSPEILAAVTSLISRVERAIGVFASFYIDRSEILGIDC